MHRIKFITYVLLIVTLGAISIARGSELQKNGFAILLPHGWVEMHRDVIDAYEKEIARLAPNVTAPHYDYGFQLDSSKKWFEYPYILVQVNNIGRIPESQLERLEGYSVQKSLDKHKKGLSSIMSDIQVGKMVYDKQTKIIWTRTEANVVNIGPISGIMGAIPTEKGFIQVMGYSLKKNYPMYEAVFQSVAVSVSPEPGLVYRPKWSDSLPPAVTGTNWEKIAVETMPKALAAVIIAVIIAALRKKKDG